MQDELGMKTLYAKVARLKADLGANCLWSVDDLPQLSLKRQVSSAWQSHMACKVSAPLIYSACSRSCLQDCM